MDLLKHLGANIKRARKLSGLTQNQLAEEADLSIDHVGAIERGLRSPSITTLEAIADALNVSIADLFQLEEQKERPASETERAILNLIKYLRNQESEDIQLLATIAKRISKSRGKNLSEN